MSQPPTMVKTAVVIARLDQVWDAWTTADGLRFISNKSNVELRQGGPYEWFLDLPPDEQGKRGGEGAQILAWLYLRMLAFSWTFPPSIPSLRNENATFQVVVFFNDIGNSQIQVELNAHGWEDGPDWHAGWAYFDNAWDKVLERMSFED